MKKIGFVALIVLSLGLSRGSALSKSNLGRDNNKTEIETISVELIDALNNRNFTIAKTKVEELLPRIKEQLKASQKKLKVQEKALGVDASVKDVDRVASARKIITKQEEIFTSLTYLKKVSPVAYRVKVDMVKELVNEYNELLNKLALIKKKTES